MMKPWIVLVSLSFVAACAESQPQVATAPTTTTTAPTATSAIEPTPKPTAEVPAPSPKAVIRCTEACQKGAPACPNLDVAHCTSECEQAMAPITETCAAQINGLFDCVLGAPMSDVKCLGRERYDITSCSSEWGAIRQCSKKQRTKDPGTAPTAAPLAP